MAPWEKKLRKKLWWAMYLTDRWTSICHGNTPHIPDGSFDTSDLDAEDLKSDEDVVGLPGCEILEAVDRAFGHVHALRFLELVKLSKLLGAIIGSGL
jgi:hypothetical protein